MLFCFNNIFEEDVFLNPTRFHAILNIYTGNALYDDNYCNDATKNIRQYNVIRYLFHCK